MFKFPFKNKKFVFGEYLVGNGYKESSGFINGIQKMFYYQNNEYLIMINDNELSLDTLKIYYKNKAVAKFNFIPNSKLLADMLLKNISDSIKDFELRINSLDI